MAQALVSAKTQTVKEIKHNSFIKRRNKLILKFFLILVVIILLSLILNKIIIETRYSFTDKNTKIKFISEGFHIKEGFEIFATDENYLVVFNYNYQDENYLSSVVDGIVYAQSMLSAKNKNVILVISVVDSENNLLYCQTNQGSVYENNELTSQECLSLIDSEFSTILVSYPANESSLVVLNLSEKLLLIKPSKKEDVYSSLLISLNKMFKDAKLIEQSLGNIQEKINSVDKEVFSSNNLEDINTDNNSVLE